MTPEPSLRPAVRLNRLIPAAPGKVYRAWLEPELLSRWLAPGTMQVTRIEVDERVGGHYRSGRERAAATAASSARFSNSSPMSALYSNGDSSVPSELTAPPSIRS